MIIDLFVKNHAETQRQRTMDKKKLTSDKLQTEQKAQIFKGNNRKSGFV